MADRFASLRNLLNPTNRARKMVLYVNAMHIPGSIIGLTRELVKKGIDYRIGGGQAAVLYTLRDKANDWDFAVAEISEDLKSVMRSVGFSEIPDSNGLSWEADELVDFIIADGKEYPTLAELGVTNVKGIKFVARSMMGYINWKDGESAYQHLQDYKEELKDTEMPKSVTDNFDVSWLKKSMSKLRSVMASPESQFQIGDKVKSLKSGKVGTIRFVDTSQGRPLLFDISYDYEEGPENKDPKIKQMNDDLHSEKLYEDEIQIVGEAPTPKGGTQLTLDSPTPAVNSDEFSKMMGERTKHRICNLNLSVDIENAMRRVNISSNAFAEDLLEDNAKDIAEGHRGLPAEWIKEIERCLALANKKQASVDKLKKVVAHLKTLIKQ